MTFPIQYTTRAACGAGRGILGAMDQEPIVCPFCRAPIPLASAKYCPYCGKRLSATGTSAVDQIKVYAVSALLPPLGLWYTYQYLRRTDPAARRIGWIATALTVVSLIIAIWIGKATMDAFNQAMQSYAGLGF